MRAYIAIALTAILLLAAGGVEARAWRGACAVPMATAAGKTCKHPAAKPIFVKHEKRRRSRDHDNARDAVKSGDVLPLSTVLAIVRRQIPGKLLDARLGQSGGRYIYRIKLRDNRNNIKSVQVDARSGNILSVR